MANKKPSASFKPGDPRASAAGKKSSRALPPELKQLREEKATQVELTIYHYIDKPIQELELLAQDVTLPGIDLLVIKCLIRAISSGDFSHIEPMLVRSVGKVQDRIEIKQKVETYHQLTLQFKDLSYEEKRQKYFELLKGSKVES
jgi:hypothetical protein